MHADFERILGTYVDLADARVHERVLATECRNISELGDGAKRMTLSMLETAIALTEARLSTRHLHYLLDLGKQVLTPPVELLPGIRAAVEAVASRFCVVLITKGDLFHHARNVLGSGLAVSFQRIEIFSEKEATIYLRVLGEFSQAPAQFEMVGNSLRSDIEPVLRLGG